MAIKLGSWMLRCPSRWLMVLLVGSLVGGCDKCGNRVKFNAPSLPKACGDNADPSG